jgi:hypothetical protein
MEAFPRRLANGCLSRKHSSKRISLPWKNREVIANSCPYCGDCAHFYTLTAFLVEVLMGLYSNLQFSWKKKCDGLSSESPSTVGSVSLYPVTTFPVRDSSQWLHFSMYPYKWQRPNSASAKSCPRTLER